MATETPNLFDKAGVKTATPAAVAAKPDKTAAKAPAAKAPEPKASKQAKGKPKGKTIAKAGVKSASGTAVAIDDPAARARAIDALPPPQSMMEVIGRAAADPRVDTDKMRALLDMQFEIERRQNKAQFEADFVRLQMQLPTIRKGGLIEVRAKDAAGNRTGAITQSTKFVKWPDLAKVIKPILHENGFGFRTRTETAPDGKLRVIAILIHANGHSEETYLDLMHDSSGSKNPVQAVGSSNSYGKRYGARNLLNIIDEDEVDDDGKAGGGTGTVDEVQQAELRRLMDDAGLTLPKFCAGLNIESLPALPDKRYKEAKDRIAQFAAQAKKAK